MKDDNSAEVIKTSATVATHERWESCTNSGGRGAKKWMS